MRFNNCLFILTFSIQEGLELIHEKPELRPVVQQKLEEIRECWSDLETTTKAKARQLFENNKPEPAVKSYSDLDSQLSHLEQQPPQLEQAHHLPTFNEQLQKFQASAIALLGRPEETFTASIMSSNKTFSAAACQKGNCHPPCIKLNSINFKFNCTLKLNAVPFNKLKCYQKVSLYEER